MRAWRAAAATGGSASKTGSAAAFTSARALYAEAGFVECERFGDDPAGPERCLIKLRLGRA